MTDYDLTRENAELRALLRVIRVERDKLKADLAAARALLGDAKLHIDKFHDDGIFMHARIDAALAGKDAPKSTPTG